MSNFEQEWYFSIDHKQALNVDDSENKIKWQRAFIQVIFIHLHRKNTKWNWLCMFQSFLNFFRQKILNEALLLQHMEIHTLEQNNL